MVVLPPGVVTPVMLAIEWPPAHMDQRIVGLTVTALGKLAGESVRGGGQLVLGSSFQNMLVLVEYVSWA